MISSRSLRSSGLALLIAGVAATAVGAESTPFSLNMDRVKMAGSLGKSKTIIIPTVKLEVTAQGSVWSQGKSGGGVNAQAHAKFHVKGLDKAFVQEVARKVQDDLAARLRAAGYTVLLYEDVKGEPDIVGRSKDSPDEKWGLPTRSRDGLTWIQATPSDEQAFSRGMTGSWAFWTKNLAKAKQATVILPELTFTVPQAWGEKEEGYKRADASVNLNEVMLFNGGMIYGMDEKGGEPNIQIQRHGQRPASEVTGTIRKLSEDTTNFSAVWGRSSADYMFTLDQAAFSEGVLRVASQINDLIVTQVKKGK